MSTGRNPTVRPAEAGPARGQALNLHVPLLVATAGYLIALALAWAAISGRKPPVHVAARTIRKIHAERVMPHGMARPGD